MQVHGIPPRLSTRPVAGLAVATDKNVHTRLILRRISLQSSDKLNSLWGTMNKDEMPWKPDPWTLYTLPTLRVGEMNNAGMFRPIVVHVCRKKLLLYMELLTYSYNKMPFSTTMRYYNNCERNLSSLPRRWWRWSLCSDTTHGLGRHRNGRLARYYSIWVNSSNYSDGFGFNTGNSYKGQEQNTLRDHSPSDTAPSGSVESAGLRLIYVIGRTPRDTELFPWSSPKLLFVVCVNVSTYRNDDLLWPWKNAATGTTLNGGPWAFHLRRQISTRFQSSTMWHYGLMDQWWPYYIKQH